MTPPMTQPDPPVTGEKLCTRCRRTLHVLAFAVDRQNPDGLYQHCRDCTSVVNHARLVRNRKPPKDYGLDSRHKD